jgi:hypothetical protein
MLAHLLLLQLLFQSLPLCWLHASKHGTSLAASEHKRLLHARWKHAAGARAPLPCIRKPPHLLRQLLLLLHRLLAVAEAATAICVGFAACELLVVAWLSWIILVI